MTLSEVAGADSESAGRLVAGGGTRFVQRCRKSRIAGSRHGAGREPDDRLLARLAEFGLPQLRDFLFGLGYPLL